MYISIHIYIYVIHTYIYVYHTHTHMKGLVVEFKYMLFFLSGTQVLEFQATPP